MRLNIRGRSGQVPVGLREYAEKRVAKLDKLFRDLQDVQIIQNFERGQHTVELTVEGDGATLRSEVRAAEAQNALDTAVDKLERQITRFKTRIRTGHRRPHPEKEPIPTAEVAAEEAAAEATVEGEEAPLVIIRRKRFPIKPMPPEEAAREMELSDHDFYMFLNEDTDTFNVLYRRRDGGYGLIEPEG